MRLEFNDDGPGPVVVLLHGFPFDRAMWVHQRSSVGSMYRVIAPDLRGHGASAAPDGIYTVDSMADDVLELLDGLQLYEPLVIGGLSMGGYIALSIAVRRPERVKGLMLMNSRAAADTPEAAKAREQRAEEIERSGETEPVIEAMLPRMFARKTFERHPELVARMHARMLRTPARTLAGTLRGLAIRPDRSADLPMISVPTLVLAGLEDQVIPLEESERMVSMMPSARLVTIPDAGHVAPLENPDPANSAILKFLEGIY
jgi:pimeloyl-ACP methyl ester carboxylesterase